MSIQPICETQFGFKSKRMKKTDMGNEYSPTNVGVLSGFAAGAGASALLFNSQIKSLSTIIGKKALLLGFKEKGMSLNDVMPKSPERSKKIIKDYKKNLLFWGLGITAVTTMLGAIVDANINMTKQKRADEKVLHIK